MGALSSFSLCHSIKHHQISVSVYEDINFSAHEFNELVSSTISLLKLLITRSLHFSGNKITTVMKTIISKSSSCGGRGGALHV